MTRITFSTTRCQSVVSNVGAWTRREFVRGAAGLVAMGRVPGGTPQLRIAYVASGRGYLEVFSVVGDNWMLLQRMPVRAPACLLFSNDQRTLYVSNEVDEYEGLPRGTVEAFGVDDQDGRLTQLGHTALSLSATRPRHMALSPDGKMLAVAAYGGGLYNLLPVAGDGSLGPPSGIFKAAGCGAHPLQSSAHPHTLCFDVSGRSLLTTDFGSDRVTTFSVEHGRLVRQSQRFTGEGSGVGDCALHPAGSVLYAQLQLENTLACYRVDPSTRDAGEAIQHLSFASLCTFALHRSGRVLYTVHEKPNELRLWHIDRNGRLVPFKAVRLGYAAPHRIILHNDSVYLLGGGSGAIREVDRRSLRSLRVARVDEAKGLLFKMM